VVQAFNKISLAGSASNGWLFVSRLRATATQLIGVVLPKLLTPLPDGFMRHGDAALEQEFLHIAVAQGEPIVKPDAVADDVAEKAVALVERVMNLRLDDATLAAWNAKPIPVMSVMKNGLSWPPL
jgi:hypothetical protein